MRLLHFDYSKRLASTVFHGKTIPPYAILSHRWGDSEVLFEDLGSNTYKEKDGYRKIEFCAKQAAQDQLQYFWIDTCCIDRWNLCERSKAINSMFRWYKNAAKCYVFLSAVSVSTAIEETPQQSNWEASFRASEWFTRGWTLQELIAPTSVEFFSCDGRWIGDKTSLKQLVHEITSIPLEALGNCPLDQFTKSERTEWARNRRTTEEEDIIYCLLGILSIFMPTTYGEGKEKALRRLQVEVEAAGSAPSTIPFSQNNHFVGRESELVELEVKLFRDKQTTIMAIVGRAGTGKSQLALELAYRTRQKSKSCSVFWIDASDIGSLHQSYASIARKLNIPGWDDEEADIKQLVKPYLSRKRPRQYLLIFNNIEDINLGSNRLSTARAANLIDYLPQSNLCSIIYITTNSNIAKRLALQNTIELGAITLRTAQIMLENYLNTPVLGSEQQKAKLLLQELLYLPLAIVQAAAYINTRNITLQKYRSRLVRKKEEVLERSSELPKDKLQEYSTTGPVATTLFISMDQIRCNSALAVDYPFLAACVDRKDIPLDLLEASSPREREDAIKTLNNYALITRRPAESALDLHQLVHHALREWLQKQERLDQQTQNTIIQLLRVFPDYDHSSRKLFTQVMEKFKKVYGDEHPDTLTRRWKEAEELEVQVMETRKRAFGDDHPDTLSSIANLASTFWNQGRWKEAEELEVQVMEMRKKVLGDENLDTLTSMANLASTYRNQGRWKEAEKLEVQVIKTFKRILGDEHPDTLTSIANLALTYQNQGRWKEAEELEVQTVETRKRVFGDEHPDTLTSMANLASTYQNQGRWKEAEELEVQVIETSKRVLGDEHPSTLISIANLASTYRNQGRWKEAEELELQLIETRKRVLGDEHPDTLTSTANLASTFSNQGRWKEAEELEVQVIETRKRVLGDKHPDTLTSMANLASMYRNQGR
ncbi:kinesin light chain [Lojkania enalia]|uniref:Kinesin light chain n=1 Tax=Lojkania enalia TaxID=147567 RepID=A0A9P4N6F7_9PLEO|nr:kinesin light chain [Didymosphaeria enalia]